LPSALYASDMTFKESQINVIVISRFILVEWIGQKLKLSVSNTEDYAIFVSIDKWPTTINEIDIVVIKPKYYPDSFSLFVQHVSCEHDEQFVANEIQ